MGTGDAPIRRPYSLLCMRTGGAVEAVEMISAGGLDEALERADALLARHTQYACIEVWQDDVRHAIRMRAG